MRIVLAAALVLLASAAPAGSAPARTASLRVVDMSPFTVHGWRFKPGEHIVVTVSSRGSHSVTVVANSTGTFTKRLPNVNVGTCDIYRVRAVGNKGSKAFLTPSPPSCGTELQP